MAVLSWREIASRSLTHNLGTPPTATRKFIMTLDGPTDHQVVINTLGIVHGSAHPEYGFLKCANGAVTEIDPYHAELSVQYDYPSQGSNDYAPNPLARPDVWSFTSSAGSMPTFFHNDGGTVKPLVNSAGEVYEGVVQLVGELKASIQGNRSAFPIGTATAATGRVNAGQYLGGAAGTWMCEGISAQQQNEVVDQAEIRYWSVTANLHFRSSGHGVYLPDVGYNQLVSGELKPCTVSHQGDKIPVTKPVALTSSGVQAATGTMPTINYYETHLTANFSSLFGTPSSY
ncbi:MAG: hypothetical protein ACR2NF_00375 [Pirellulales bacterium]